MTLLKTKNLSKSFGGNKAVSNLDFELEAGEIRGIIGPNGSGKSTFFNLITGIYKPDVGSQVWFDGHDITNAGIHDIAARGMGRTFQLLRVFAEMSVMENLLVGHHLHITYGVASAIFGRRHVREEEKRVKVEMMELLSFIGLADYAELSAAELSVGQRRLLSLGRAMAMRPRLLLLDEPAAGLSPVNVDNLLNIVLRLKERYQLTLIIVEHILKVVMETCEKVTVLDYGVKIAEGTPEAVKNDHDVIEAYLGQTMNDEEVRTALQA